MADPASESRLSLRGNIEIAFKTWGDTTDPSSETWIFIHGWLDNAGSFDLLAPAIIKLSRTPLRIICVDLAGHGLSGSRHLGTYHLIDYAADIIYLADQLKIQRFSVLGHSLGTGVASILGGSFPDRIKRVVLIEGIGSSETPGNAPKAFAQSLEERETRAPSVFDTVEDAALKRSKHNVIGTLDIEAARILASRGVVIHKETGKASWSYDPAVKEPSRARLHTASVEEFFRNMTCPVLLVATGDGIFQRATVFGQKFFSESGYVIMFLVYVLARIGSWLPFIGPLIAKQLPLIWIGYAIAKRVRLIRNLTIQYLPKGGHHPHLLPMFVPPIAEQIVSFSGYQSIK